MWRGRRLPCAVRGVSCEGGREGEGGGIGRSKLVMTVGSASVPRTCFRTGLAGAKQRMRPHHDKEKELKMGLWWCGFCVQCVWWCESQIRRRARGSGSVCSSFMSEVPRFPQTLNPHTLYTHTNTTGPKAGEGAQEGPLLPWGCKGGFFPRLVKQNDGASRCCPFAIGTRKATTDE